MSSRRFLLAVALLVSFTAWSAAADRGSVTKYVRFQAGDTTAYGILEGDRVRELSGDLFGKWAKTERLHALDEVTLLVPSARPTKVLALAGNYRDHLGDTPPHKNPELFYKTPSCLQRHEGPIIQPKDTENVHYEGELVIVIGRRASHVAPEQALDYVLGITCGNDVSARSWQKNDVQWWRAKGSDTFGPCGPYIAAGLDYSDLDLALRVNGEVRQKTTTKNMVHDIPQTVSFVSQYVTLEPGDLIYTGTPGKTQPIKPGDVVEVEIEGVGVLRNRVVAQKE